MRFALVTILLWGAVAMGGPLKLMSWNIHHGVGMDGKLDLERIAKVISAEKPDLVALQEVDVRCARSGGVDQAVELGKLTGMTAVFGKAIDLGAGEYGQAVLTRLPVVSSKVHPLPGTGEKRIALEVRVKDGEREFSFVTVHLDNVSAATRVPQAKAVIEALAGREQVALAGDFNDTPDSATMKEFGEGWKVLGKDGPANTIPAPKPKLEIDFLLIRGFEIVEKTRVLEEKVASDHRPIIGSVK